MADREVFTDRRFVVSPGWEPALGSGDVPVDFGTKYNVQILYVTLKAGQPHRRHVFFLPAEDGATEYPVVAEKRNGRAYPKASPELLRMIENGLLNSIEHLRRKA